MSKTRCLALLLGLFSCCFAARAQDVLVVANKGMLISVISNSNLHAIFTGEKTRFVDGSPAVPVILKGGPVHEVFLKKHVG
jgi:hypothetical protein